MKRNFSGVGGIRRGTNVSNGRRMKGMGEERTYYEFFAGGGMARAGLGAGWRCLFANDFDHKKSRIYRDNWGASELKTADVGALKIGELPETPQLAWASFPCQDLSLAGAGAGLRGDRSGTFWPFWNLMKSLIADGRAPNVIALENVCGTLTSHGGKDFATIIEALQDGGYDVGAMVIDAALFIPQSRPRLFVVAVRSEIELPASLVSAGPCAPWHTAALRTAHAGLNAVSKASWIWWNLPRPTAAVRSLSELIEEQPTSVPWFSADETKALLAMMSDVNKAKVDAVKRLGCRIVGGVYKRTRSDEKGNKVQRAEVRFDEMSGCLRTPAGGSSRQVILVIEGRTVRARLISSRETARLMGLPDSYTLPDNYNEAYHLTGDGVVVPVVRYLAANILEPILAAIPEPRAVAAA